MRGWGRGWCGVRIKLASLFLEGRATRGACIWKWRWMLEVQRRGSDVSSRRRGWIFRCLRIGWVGVLNQSSQVWLRPWVPSDTETQTHTHSTLTEWQRTEERRKEKEQQQRRKKKNLKERSWGSKRKGRRTGTRREEEVKVNIILLHYSLLNQDRFAT